MKTVVTALALFSILLLMAGATNAATCDYEKCYSMYEQCDKYDFYEHVNANLCLNLNGYGTLEILNSDLGPDYEGTLDAVYFGNSRGFKFDGRPRDYMVYGQLNSGMNVAFFIQTSELFGDSQLINGVGYAYTNGGVRCRLWGWRVNPSNCLPPG
jgi:hypothetical protein